MDLFPVSYLILSARGAIIALDLPKAVPSSMKVILVGEFKSILKTMSYSGLSFNFSFVNNF